MKIYFVHILKMLVILLEFVDSLNYNNKQFLSMTTIQNCHFVMIHCFIAYNLN